MLQEREVDPKVTEEAQKLIDQGWYQVSRAYCTVARLPKGKTGIQALIDAELSGGPGGRKDAPQWAARMGEHHAGDHFLRMYAKGDLQKQLSSTVFNEFRRLGGGTYHFARLNPMLRKVREMAQELEWKSGWDYDLGVAKGWEEALSLFTKLFEHNDFRIEADQATRFNEEAMRNIDYRGRAAVALSGQDPNLQGVDHEQESGGTVLPSSPNGAVPTAMPEE